MRLIHLAVWGLISTLSFAGVPTEDPVVFQLQQTFLKSRMPALIDLNLGYTWICDSYSARKGVFKNKQRVALFKFSGGTSGFIQNGRADRNVGTYAFNAPTNSMAGVNRNGQLSAVRVVEGTSQLIEEYSRNPVLFDRDSASSIDPSKHVTEYSICAPATTFGLPQHEEISHVSGGETEAEAVSSTLTELDWKAQDYCAQYDALRTLEGQVAYQSWFETGVYYWHVTATGTYSCIK